MGSPLMEDDAIFSPLFLQSNNDLPLQPDTSVTGSASPVFGVKDETVDHDFIDSLREGIPFSPAKLLSASPFSSPATRSSIRTPKPDLTKPFDLTSPERFVTPERHRPSSRQSVKSDFFDLQLSPLADTFQGEFDVTSSKTILSPVSPKSKFASPSQLKGRGLVSPWAPPPPLLSNFPSPLHNTRTPYARKIEHSTDVLRPQVRQAPMVASKPVPVAAQPKRKLEVPQQSENTELPATRRSSKSIKQELDEDSASRKCNCKRSKCLKLYCECFSVQRLCDGCSCTGCFNIDKHFSAVLEARKLKLNTNPAVFEPKIKSKTHQKGCHCKKGCKKRYCECFQAGIACGSSCKCVSCLNHVPHAKHEPMEGSSGDGVEPSTSVEEEPSGVEEPIEEAPFLERIVYRPLFHTPPRQNQHDGVRNTWQSVSNVCDQESPVRASRSRTACTGLKAIKREYENTGDIDDPQETPVSRPAKAIKQEASNTTVSSSPLTRQALKTKLSLDSGELELDHGCSDSFTLAVVNQVREKPPTPTWKISIGGKRGAQLRKSSYR